MAEDVYSIVLYERLVLDTPWNSGHPMEYLLVTSLRASKMGEQRTFA